MTVRRIPPSYLYISFGLLGVAAYYFANVPGLSFGVTRIGLEGMLDLSAVCAVLVGVRLNRPSYRTPWILLAIGQAFYLAADLCFYTYHYALGDLRYPAPADALYLARFPFLALGLLLIARRRSAGGDRSSLLDALILSSGAMLLSWNFLMRPYLGGTGMSFLATATSLAFPAMDLVLLAVTLRLFVGGARRAPAFFLLGGSVLFLLFSDSVYGWMQLAGTYTTGNFLDATWACSYLLLGAAALHPSMRFLAERRQTPEPVVSRARIVPLAAAALVGPVTLAVSNLADYDIGADGEIAIAITGAFVFVLVIVRLFDLMRAQQSAHDALARSEEELRRVVGTLERTEQERARLFDQTVEAAEEERMRVAGELHDGPIQHLTALALTLDVTALRLDRGDASSVKSALTDARANVAEQMLELRRLMVELRPPALDEVGLEAALRDCLAALDLRIDARCEFVGGLGDRRLGSAMETTLYRVAQEALSNVEKYARAGLVRMTLLLETGSVLLRIEDDGVGFSEPPASELIRNGRFGLVGMRVRIERTGGEWHSRSRPGEGTLVEARVPVTIAKLAPVQPDQARAA